MKKLLCIFLATAIVSSVAGCGKKEKPNMEKEPTVPATEAQIRPEEYGWDLYEEDLELTMEVHQTEETPALYRVRKTADDSQSQKGAFSDFENAKQLADQYKDEGYEVYDMNGSVVYNPNEGTSDGQPHYRVRKSAYDAESQVGAYSLFDNAKAEADARKAEGYKVYDMNGNFVYDPNIESVGDTTYYRVRKSAYDADSQLGAFYFFANAKDLADQHKSEGYEVYDMNGYLVYTP